MCYHCHTALVVEKLGSEKSSQGVCCLARNTVITDLSSVVADLSSVVANLSSVVTDLSLANSEHY